MFTPTGIESVDPSSAVVPTLVQEQLGDARLTAETLGHVGLGSVAG